jgi:hypothetical protein
MSFSHRMAYDMRRRVGLESSRLAVAARCALAGAASLSASRSWLHPVPAKGCSAALNLMAASSPCWLQSQLKLLMCCLPHDAHLDAVRAGASRHG